MLHFNVVHRPDYLIHSGFELHHLRKICRNGISGPDIRGCNPVQGKPPGLDNIQHLQTILAIRYPGYVLGTVVNHGLPSGAFYQRTSCQR